MFTFKHFLLLNFHCVTYSAMVGDEGGLGWVCEAERLSKQSFAARVSLQSGQICIDVITLRHTTFLAEICSA